MCVPGIATLSTDRGKFPVLKAIRFLHCYESACPAINWFPKQPAFLPASFLCPFFPSFLPSTPFSFPLSTFLQWILLRHLLFVSDFAHRCSSASAMGFCLNTQFLKFRFGLYLQLPSHSVIPIVHAGAPKHIVGEKSRSVKMHIAFLPRDLPPEEISICSNKMWMPQSTPSDDSLALSQ